MNEREAAMEAVEAILDSFENTNDVLWTTARYLEAQAEKDNNNAIDLLQARAAMKLYQENKTAIEEARKLLRK